MTNSLPPILSALDESTLKPVVRKSLHLANLQVTDWHVCQLGGGFGNPVSLGVYRIEGTAHDGARDLPWSVILKLIQSPANSGWTNMGEGDNQGHWNYWRREVLAYRVGLLDSLPPGLAAPSCYEAVDLPGDMAALWLEDLGSAQSTGWSLDRYALAARHLGRLNGLYSSGDGLPAYPWLSRERHRQWLATPELQDIPWDHPLVAARYPGGEADPFRRMLAARDRFLARLDTLPLALSHGDTYPTNLVSRLGPGGEEETVALDWALVGLEPLGSDLGQLTLGAQSSLTASPPEQVADRLFQSYVDGLRDSGCRVDAQQVRFGFAAGAALRIGLFRLVMSNLEIARGGASAVSQGADAPMPDPFEAVMAREAWALLDSV